MIKLSYLYSPAQTLSLASYQHLVIKHCPTQLYQESAFFLNKINVDRPRVFWKEHLTLTVLCQIRLQYQKTVLIYRIFLEDFCYYFEVAF